MTTMNKIKPTNIIADRNKRIVTITWNDGKECSYSFAGLRAVCPCAGCRGGHDNMGQPADKDVLRNSRDDDIDLKNVGAVGSYALQFVWSDGHSAGIYTWKYLYEACLGVGGVGQYRQSFVDKKIVNGEW